MSFNNIQKYFTAFYTEKDHNGNGSRICRLYIATNVNLPLFLPNIKTVVRGMVCIH